MDVCFSSPEGPTPKSPEHGFAVKLILAEFKFTDDIHMHRKHAEIKTKYAPLVDALRTAGWAVHPEEASIVVGHRASTLHMNKDALHIKGITGKKDQQHAQNSLTDMALRHAEITINHTRTKRATLTRQRDSTS